MNLDDLVNLKVQQQKFELSQNLWRIDCIITKTYNSTQFTDKFGCCLNKSYRNKKLFSVKGQIVW